MKRNSNYKKIKNCLKKKILQLLYIAEKKINIRKFGLNL